MKKIDLTYGGKLRTLFNAQKKANLNVNYTIDGKTGQPTTTSICICLDPLFMITFDYQDLKELVGDAKTEETVDYYKTVAGRADNQIAIIKQIMLEQPPKNVEELEWLDERLTAVQRILLGSDSE